MDFSIPEAYTELQQEIITFVENEINPELLKEQEKYRFQRELWTKCAEARILSLAVPSAYGGKYEEVEFLKIILAMEAFGYACKSNGLPFGINAQMWTVQTPILHFGSEYIKEKYLIPMVEGEMIGSHALTEPETGSDIYNMSTSATKVEGGYLLNGEKHLITLGPVSDLALVLAQGNPKLGKWGISGFIVETAWEGVTISPRKLKMGLNNIPIGGYVFKDCFVPEENVLGKEGLGFSILNHSLEYDRCCILASQLGAMRRQLEETIARAKERSQFGQAIGKFQSVSNRIADMKLRLECSQLLLYKTAWLKSQNKSSTMEGALLKLQLSESFVASSLDSIRTYGGIGYLEETGVEENLRDSIGGLLYAGTSDIQRNIISTLLGL